MDAAMDTLGVVRDEDVEGVTEHLAGRRARAARFPGNVDVGDAGVELVFGVAEVEVAVEDARRDGRGPGRERAAGVSNNLD